jgi:hypothetical protein
MTQNPASIRAILARRAKFEAQILQSEIEKQYHWQSMHPPPDTHSGRFHVPA